MSHFGDRMNTISSSQYNEEKLSGYSAKPLDLITYWALFAFCVLLTHKIAISGDSDFDTYNTEYDLDGLNVLLQKESIDITKAYKAFGLFGYSM